VQIGQHRGAWRFTPGQRRGIGVAAAEPLYALRVDRGTNTLVVGPRDSLACRRVEVAGALHVPVDRADAKLRYRSAPVPTRVVQRDGGFTLELEEPAYAIAPGQLAALYDDGVVVGAGTITSASC